jgi:hypothetical protein
MLPAFVAAAPARAALFAADARAPVCSVPPPPLAAARAPRRSVVVAEAEPPKSKAGQIFGL